MVSIPTWTPGPTSDEQADDEPAGGTLHQLTLPAWLGRGTSTSAYRRDNGPSR
jgi:hypothetical protein